jgi:hypothetical protein
MRDETRVPTRSVGTRPSMTNHDQPRMVQGKHAILVVFAVGLIGGLGSWWYYQRLQRRVLELWGPEAAALMVHAPRAEALWLTAAGTSSQRGSDDVDLGGTRFAVRQRADVSRAPGFIHLRHSLINDGSFDWEAPAGDCQPEWDYALRFVDGQQSATVLVAINCRRAKLAGATREVSLAIPAAARRDDRDKAPALQRFLEDQFHPTEEASNP